MYMVQNQNLKYIVRRVTTKKFIDNQYIMDEKVIETKKCKHCQSSFAITDKDIHFYDMMSPTFA